jgi:hypothetical protein
MPAMSLPFETGFSIGLLSHDHGRANVLGYSMSAKYFNLNLDNALPEVTPCLAGDTGEFHSMQKSAKIDGLRIYEVENAEKYYVCTFFISAVPPSRRRTLRTSPQGVFSPA